MEWACRIPAQEEWQWVVVSGFRENGMEEKNLRPSCPSLSVRG